MNKSVYSIVLADEVVEAVDRLAYEMNTSRSNLINQILAERVSLMTPEMHMREIFDAIRGLMDGRFQLAGQPSETMLSIRSPVRYKYKPTIRYSIELSRDMSGKVGRLKVSFRTKSEQLLGAADSFFKSWGEMENRLLKGVFENGVPSAAEQGRYVRDFYSPAGQRLSDRQIGEDIAGYIRLMDGCIQEYFDGLSAGESRGRAIETAYREYLEKGIRII